MTTWLLDPEGGNDFSSAYDLVGARLGVASGTTAPIETTVPVKFAAPAIKFSSASANGVVSYPNSADWNLSGQFTIEGWVYWNTHTGTSNEVILAQWTSGNQGWALKWDSTNVLAFRYSTTGSDSNIVGALPSSPALSTGSYHHVAVDRDASNVVRVYLDGVVIASATVSATIFASTTSLTAGNDGGLASKFPGTIESLKISNVARYGGAFTPPASPFTSDANTKFMTLGGAGTDFIRRKKGLTAVPASAGDAIHVMASYSPISLGSATWTDNSGTITLASAVNLLLDDFETAWTAAANVTATTIANYFKSGTKAASLSVASGFTGGLIAYKAVSNLDLSAYSCLSVIWRPSAALTQKFQIALCSDSAGATPIVMLDPGYLYNATIASPGFMRFDNGGAALPSGINSIAIYATGGKPFSSSGIIYLDNLIACTAWGSANHLSHGCLIGKNTTGEPEWYSLMAISGTTVTIGYNTDWGQTSPARPYRGVSETVTTYALCPTQGKWGSTTNALTPGSGAFGNPITLTGGWNRTDMSTQTGQTWLSGEWFFSNGIYNSGSNASNWSLPDRSIGFAHYLTAGLTGCGTNWEFKILGMTACNNAFSVGAPTGFMDIDLGNLIQNEGGCIISGTGALSFRMRARRAALTAGYPYQFRDFYDDALHDVNLGILDGNNYGISTYPGCRVRVRGTTFKNHLTASVYAQGGTGSGELLLDRPVLQDATFTTIPSISYGGAIRVTAANGNAWDNRTYTFPVTELTVQSPVHGTTLQSRQLTINSTTNATQPIYKIPYRTRLARIACKSGATITYSIWQQRSTLQISAGLCVQAGQLAGVADQTVLGSAAINTWEQVTISFTPTEDGVIDVYGSVQSVDALTTGTVTYGDASVSST
jgi:hypothetical protein